MPPTFQFNPLYFAGAFALALALSAVLTPLVGRWATRIGMVAQPRKDRWHQKPTPLLGGIAIYAATTIAIIAFSRMDLRLWGLVAGGTILFVTGLVDDFRHLRPHTKLVFQVLAACVLLLSGIRIETENWALIAIPLTILWVVGLSNAFNLLDNMDGLSSGTSLIASGFLFAFSLTVGNAGLAILSVAIAGGSLGFLIYNFNPARIFMGDSGSMYLGFMLAGVSLLGTRDMASDLFFVLLVPGAMMALPIMDTTLVTVVRTLEGRPLSQGGRDHLSHRLVALGLSERQAVLLLYAFAAGFGSLGLIARSVGFYASLAVGGALLAAAIIFGAFLAQVRIVSPSQFAEAERAKELNGKPVVNGMIMFKRELGLAALDLMLIGVAYVGAYVMKFGYRGVDEIEADLGAPWPNVFMESVPLVIAVKVSLLLAFQVYRGMLRYVSISDLMQLAKVTITSSILLLVALPLIFNDQIFPRSVLIIDWLLFTVLLIGSRASFAALTDGFARLQQKRVPNLLVVGAGDLGELVLRSIVRSQPSAYRPVGILDPDPGKRNRSIHGVVVLGNLEDLERVTEEQTVDIVVIAVPQSDQETVLRARELCESLELLHFPASTFVEMHFAGGLLPGTPAPELPAPAHTS